MDGCHHRTVYGRRPAKASRKPIWQLVLKRVVSSVFKRLKTRPKKLLDSYPKWAIFIVSFIQNKSAKS
jgi:hypothetical protein